MSHVPRTVLLCAFAAGVMDHSVYAQQAPLVEQYLISGRLADGDRALARQLTTHPDDAQAKFGRGVLQFVQAVEHLSQSLSRYGLRDHGNNLPPILRMPVPQNPKPEELTYEQSRQILATFVSDLARAEKTLAGVPSQAVKLPLHFGQFRLDLNGDEKVADEETLWRIFAGVQRGVQVPRDEAEKFVIAFDTADIAWLRGYCHLLMFVGEVVLAHDGRELFERTGHIFFARTKSPYPYLRDGSRVFEFGEVDIVDLIALIHLLNLPVAEPDRMRAALSHLEQVIPLSRQNWKQIMEETDDDREWIPSPKQTGVLPGVRVTQEMTEGWQQFLDEAELILQGKKLIPFWRGDNHTQGVNVRRVFSEPRQFDLVLWVQGTAAKPYLEEGPLTVPDTWQRINQRFNGQFVGFAFWFN
jgi:hypothetical protein